MQHHSDEGQRRQRPSPCAVSALRPSVRVSRRSRTPPARYTKTPAPRASRNVWRKCSNLRVLTSETRIGNWFVTPSRSEGCSCAAEAAFRDRRACQARQGAADALQRTRRSLKSGCGADGADRRRRFDMHGRLSWSRVAPNMPLSINIESRRTGGSTKILLIFGNSVDFNHGIMYALGKLRRQYDNFYQKAQESANFLYKL